MNELLILGMSIEDVVRLINSKANLIVNECRYI